MSSSISSNIPNSNKRTGKAGFLGSTPTYEPPFTAKASRDVSSEACGVASQNTQNPDNRILRLERQRTSSCLIPKSRVSKCLKVRISPNVTILKSKEHGKCHFAGLMTCGSVWTCPVCAAKISERRRVELKKAVDQHHLNGGSVLLITFTTSHKREDDLQSLLDKQSLASQWFYRHRTYKELKKRYFKRGRVRALEVNHGQSNGWHPHVHELWFLDVTLHDYSILKAEIFALWLKACKRFDLGLPSEKHGIDVRGGDQASAYVTKYGLDEKKTWGLECELTKSSVKKGRNGSRSAFQFLDDYLLGDKQSGALFIEYSEAFKGKQQLTWSRGLKAQFDLESLTDEEIAEQKEDEAEVVTRVSPAQWLAVLRQMTKNSDSRLLLLNLAENGGQHAVDLYLSGLPIPEPYIHH